MSSIKPSHLVISMALALALGGCGNSNDKAVFSQEGGHSSGWTTSHKTSAKADLESCSECHGASLDGGIAKVSCTLCHLGSAESVHPTQWGNYAYARHKSYSTAQRTATCATAVCHGSALQGVAGSGPACATACHLGGTYKKHPVGWSAAGASASHKQYFIGLGYITNVVNPGFDFTSCKTSACHGTNGRGVFLSGPACDSCHTMK